MKNFIYDDIFYRKPNLKYIYIYIFFKGEF